MKRILLSLAILACSASVQAQVTLEKRYNGYLETTKLSDGSIKYYDPNPTNAQLRVYNQDHSIFRTVAVPTVAGVTLNYIEGVSDKLFNQDAPLEYAAFYSDYNQTTNVERDVMRVWNETGVQLAAADTAEFARFYNTPSGAKMLVTGVNGTGSSITVSRVYGLGGTYTPLRTKTSAEQIAAQPFPNPASEQIQLPYTVGRGQVGALRVLDAAGRVAAVFQVDDHTNHLVLRTGQLGAGVYTYTVQTTTGVSAGRRFIVRN